MPEGAGLSSLRATMLIEEMMRIAG